MSSQELLDAIKEGDNAKVLGLLKQGADPNSRSTEPPLPAIGTPTQSPIAPASGQSVQFTVPVSAATAIEVVEIRYRPRGESRWRTARLERSQPPADGSDQEHE